MLDLHDSHAALARVHHGFVDESLDELLVAKRFTIDCARYSIDEITWARRAWELRTLDEYRSQVGFSEFLLELSELGLAFDVLGTAARVVRDEAVHVELCRRMVKALGGSDVIPGQVGWARSDKRLPLMERVLSGIVGSLCIGETFSAKMIAAVREETTDATAHAVLTQLLKDESMHGRFGWHLLELVIGHIGEERKRFIEGIIPGCLEAAEKAMRFDGPRKAKLNPFGDMQASKRKRVFEKGLVQVKEDFRRFGLVVG